TTLSVDRVKAGPSHRSGVYGAIFYTPTAQMTGSYRFVSHAFSADLGPAIDSNPSFCCNAPYKFPGANRRFRRWPRRGCDGATQSENKEIGNERAFAGGRKHPQALARRSRRLSRPPAPARPRKPLSAFFRRGGR